MQELTVNVQGIGTKTVSIPISHGSTTLAIIIALGIQHDIFNTPFTILSTAGLKLSTI